jgi:hypothetical protein
MSACTSFFPENPPCSAAANLALGLLTLFLGRQWGLLGLRFLTRRPLPFPWSLIASTLLGLMIESLAVEILAFAGLSSPQNLRGLWGTLLAGAAILWVLEGSWRLSLTPPRGFSFGFIGCLVVLANLINLGVALAPSTKIDELYYHMLLPCRILQEGQLRFHRLPWEAAIWPQMHYQIGLAPLHALGFPDAGNVVSWGCSVLLQVLLATLVRLKGYPPSVGAALAGLVAIGPYPVVWHVTSGAHAFGDLALTTMLLAVLLSHEIEGDARSVLIGVTATAAAASKIVFLPLTAVALLGAWWQTGFSRRQAARLLLPGVIFYLPLMVWTQVQSGSPFGPVGAGAFGESRYDPAAVAGYFDLTRMANHQDALLMSAVRQYSPLLWCGVLAFLVRAGRDRDARIGVLFLSVQVSIIAFVVQNDLRFLGGLPYALAAAAVLREPSPRAAALLRSRTFGVVAGILLVPWLVAQAYYARPLAAAGFCLTSAEEHLRKFTAFRKDFLALDAILPENAVILVDSFRINSVNSCRPVVMTIEDAPWDVPVYRFELGEDASSPERHPWRPEVVYRNDAAVLRVFREPGRAPLVGPLRVVRLSRPPGEE